jgi:hypothetical protein
MAQIYQCPECIEAELAERMAKLDEEDEDE